MEAELWRPIRGYEGAYAVSNQGRVKSLDRSALSAHRGPRKVRGRTISPGKTSAGYLSVALSAEGVKRYRLVHRLVAEAFLPKSSLPEVNHIDFDPTNNHARNLEWVSSAGNNAHSAAAGRLGTKLSHCAVADIRALRANGALLKEIAMAFGIHTATVSKIVLEQRWRHAHIGQCGG